MVGKTSEASEASETSFFSLHTENNRKNLIPKQRGQLCLKVVEISMKK